MIPLLSPTVQYLSGLEEAVYKNIDACKQIANIVRTSFGPNGWLSSTQASFLLLFLASLPSVYLPLHYLF